jgi:alpha-L-rhamnosidase
MGATTMWERWDSMLPDGSVNPGEMTSFNHYALGSVADWLHRVVAGLAPGAPGYRRIVVRPRPGGGITSASARLRSPYGLVETRWRLDGERLDRRVVVPPNTIAEVWMPDADPVEVGSGTHAFHATTRSRLPGLTP